MRLSKLDWPQPLRRWLSEPLVWCFGVSLLVHSGLLYGLRQVDVSPEPVVLLPPPIEVTLVDPPALATKPQPIVPLGAPLPPPPPVLGQLPPSPNLPPLPPPPSSAPAVKPSALRPVPVQPTPPPPVPLPPPVDTPTPRRETFDPANTSTSDGLANLSRWIARLQPELSRSPQLLRLTELLPTQGCPWEQAGPTVWGVLVNPQGELAEPPELLRSSGYATLNQKARRLVTGYDFKTYAAETPQALMVEVAWENTCSGAE
ncbi:MAG: hypothetical protein RMI89_03535 [Gloeomargarita sp. SKYBB_i_bin120]|nr:hypothetical protein [Gloeomargarita sp. SKYG98]MCS7292031.1 hypothetical protein [Gloeomargarita sp. SKYB120]MDW8177591.1 hypothetical protein [Gloeomargarita sp. SKYBB_i_bin120]